MVVAGIVGCDWWLAGCFFLFSLSNTWICVVGGVEVGGFVPICWWCGGQWSGGGLGFANLLVVVWVCWDVKFGDSNFILLGLNLIFWVLNLLGLCSCSNI